MLTFKRPAKKSKFVLTITKIHAIVKDGLALGRNFVSKAIDK